MMKYILSMVIAFLLLGCNNKKEHAATVTGVNYNWLDSIKKSSDSTYTKKYGTNKFATAVYYVNTKEGITCQVMKDVADTIRQIIVTKNNRRLLFAQYYPNGQLMAKLPLDTTGEYSGQSTYYYENGMVESEGNYQRGFKLGEWKNYSTDGKQVLKSEYDSNGTVIRK